MQGYNLIVVFSLDKKHILMCKRNKDPYMGLSNFPGGKIEPYESSEQASYRELFEETSISSDMISLTHLMDFNYPLASCYVEVYVGQLKEEVAVYGEENDLYWSDLNHDFFDMKTYAGEGNIGHILEQIKLFEDVLFD